MALTAVLLLGILVGPCAGPAAADIHYVYDALGRLAAVVDQNGNGAVYAYDAVGNLLSIQRFDATGLPGPVGITYLAFDTGKVGATIQIFGKGFSSTLSENAVSFNGVPTTVIAATAISLTVTVPVGATTGPITVTTPLGTVTSAAPFQVLGAITVSPATASVTVAKTQQFSALDDGVPISAVLWSVNAAVGGDSRVGTISTSGLYTAPATVPTPATVTVTATRQADVTLTASAAVTVVPPPPVFLAAPGVAVAVEEADAAFTVAGGVSVARAPVVTMVSPASGALGATNLLVTLTGAGFADATEVAFLLNNTPDANIIAVNPVVDGSGTSVTVEVSISGSAALGPRVVRITTPAGSSTAAGTGVNLFTVP